MEPQPTSSPSIRITDDSISKEITVEPRIDVNYLMAQLCNILQVEVEEEEDISSQSFGESVLRYLREKVGCWNEGIRSMEGFLNAHARLRHSPGPAVISQLQPENHHSNGRTTNSESSQILPNENSEIVMESVQTDLDKMSPEMSIASLPISLRYSPEVISIASTPQYSVSSPYLSSSSLCIVSETCPTTVLTATDSISISNDNSPPCMSPALLTEGRQSSLPSLEAFEALPTSTNVTETGNWVVVDDTFVNELIEPPLPSSSRQACAAKSKAKRYDNSNKTEVRRRRRVLKQKIHAAQDFRHGFYWCSCRSKFKSTVAQKHHIKFFNSEWKFKCGECTRKCFDLSHLKLHLKREHGVVNPLKEYVIGCTLCGIGYRSRTEFAKHKKREHNINEGPRRKRKSRRPGMSPRYPGMSQRRPRMSPSQGQSALSPQNTMPIVSQDLEIDLEQHQNNVTQGHYRYPNKYEVIDLASDDDEEREIDTLQSSRQQGNISPLTPQMDQQPHPNHIMNGNQSGNGVGMQSHHGRPNYGKCYGCIMCSKVFRHLKQLRRHVFERHQSKWKKVKCGLCGMEFDSCRKFHKHRVQNHLGSSDEQDKGTDSPQPSTSVCPSSPPQMDGEEHHHEDVINDEIRKRSSNSVQDFENYIAVLNVVKFSAMT